MEERVDRVETAIADFRAHTDAGFAAVHQQFAPVHQQFAAVHQEFAAVRGEMAASSDAVHQALIRMQSQHDKDFRFLNTRIDSLDTRIEAMNTRMSALHEDVIARIATLGELWTRPRRTSRKKE